MSVQISTRIDSDTRDAAVRALAADGLDLPTAIRMFVKRTADLGTLPFSVGIGDSYVPNSELRATVAEAKAGKNLSEPLGLDATLSYLDSL